MSTTPFTCERFADHLADLLEHDAAPAVVAAMDAHAAECAECRGLRMDLEAIASGAAALPELRPSRDLWAGIAQRIEAPVVPLGAPRGARDRGSRRWWAHPAVAAAALVGITAGVTYTATREAMAPAAPAPAATVAAVTAEPDAASTDGSGTGTESGVAVPRSENRGSAGEPTPTREIAAGDPSSRGARGATSAPAIRAVPTATLASYRPGALGSLDSLYFREIVRLRQVLNERRGQLDSTTVEVLDRNMRVIDRAIQECRDALAADPASSFLNEQLNEALETKIELLRTAATMAVGE